MASWTLDEVIQATNGTLHYAEHTQTIEGVSFDTRTLKAGNLFIPLVAERNGHEFIQSAIGKGAKATFWSDSLESAPKDIAVIKVEDTLKAFQAFSKYFLNKVKPKVIGITGSNGKTTTKDMIEAVAATQFKTHKTVGNFNNHLGLPLTILEMNEETEVLVLEMGMSEKGEIHLLSKIAEPDIAVITMIGESHIEFLGSRKAIADAKLEILDGMDKGTFVYPGEDSLLQERLEARDSFDSLLKMKTFGNESTNEIYPILVNPELRQTTFSTNKEPNQSCVLPVAGVYNVQNALAALLVGEELGINLTAAYESLAHFELTKNRLEWKDGWNQSTLLNDAYNASPSSMKAVLEYFQEVDVPSRKLAVLGDILELGEQSEEMHRGLKEAIQPSKIDLLILYGKEMHALYEEMRLVMDEKQLHYFSGSKEKLVDYLKTTLQPDDTVLLKSSLSTGMLEVVSKLSQDENK